MRSVKSVKSVKNVKKKCDAWVRGQICHVWLKGTKTV
jgi:hypothetical protein